MNNSFNYFQWDLHNLGIWVFVKNLTYILLILRKYLEFTLMDTDLQTFSEAGRHFLIHVQLYIWYHHSVSEIKLCLNPYSKGRTALCVIPVSVSEQCLQPTFTLRTVKFVFQSKYNIITIHKLKGNTYPYVNYKVFHNSGCKMLWTTVCCNSISTTGIQKCWLQTPVTQGNIPPLVS